jgi:carboxypeptidase C (cathepsin A)
VAAFLALGVGAIIVHSSPLRADEPAEVKQTPKSTTAERSGGKESKNEEVEAHFSAEQQRSTGSVTVEGHTINYVAYAGTLVVHPKGWDDVPQNAPKDEDKSPQQEASMFYVAYFKVPEGGATAHGKSAGDAANAPDLTTVGSPTRPVTFLYNGGPGSSTVWLHMGAFGPRRVITDDHQQTPPAPYRLVNNDYSLLDASDLVFVDAPGTGFSRIAGKDRDKAFYGVDPDSWAFSDFIVQFLSRYGRWNAAKYLFGESYGTTRSAALSYLLETHDDIDLNGVMLLSQILNYDLSADGPQFNPGIDLPYQLALPTYTATAWYHHKLPGAQRELAPLLQEVEQFAMNDYQHALNAGTTLSADERDRIVEKLHEYTGLPEQYIRTANLRINGGEFEKSLQGAELTTGRLDTRFVGPTLDPLSEEAEYDPQSAAISSAYVSSFNDYVRRQLHYGQEKLYKPTIEIAHWDFQHAAPGSNEPLQQSTNVMPDLAAAMKMDPQLHVLLNAGYFDLATPFYEGVYEMQHLDIPEALRSHIELQFYESGHMVYAHEPALKQLHDNVAAFIQRTQGAAAAPGPRQGGGAAP